MDLIISNPFFFSFLFLFCFSFMLLVSLCKELLSFLPGFVTQTDYVCLSTVLLYIWNRLLEKALKTDLGIKVIATTAEAVVKYCV